MIKLNKKILIVIFSIFTHLSSSASLITSDLTIEGTIGLGFIDPISGVWVTPDTTFSGNMNVGSNSSQVNQLSAPGDLVVSGDNTNNVAITDTTQVLSFNTLLDSLATSLDFDENVGLDFGIYIENTHATDTFTVDFSFNFFNIVSALGTGFSQSIISLSDNDGEFFFSDMVSDVDYGNMKNGVLDGVNFGGNVDERGTYNFSYTLLAGENMNFSGFVQTFFGWSDGQFPLAQSSNATLSITSISQIQVGQPPVEVPEPSSLILFLTVLILCARTQSKRI